MLFCVILTVFSLMFSYMMVADLYWGSPSKRARYLTDPRMIAVQLRSLWELIDVIVYMARGTLPADHPYRDVACGFAAAYVATVLTFDVYHLVTCAILCLAVGVRHGSTAAASAIQLFEPLMCVAVFASLTSITVTLTPGMTPESAMSIALQALRWTFTGVDCPIGIGAGVATALLLLLAQSRQDEEKKKI
jgi:hypothetical protein